MKFPNISSRYNIIKTLGEGGMGLVYLAEDKANSNRLTAVKTIRSSFLKKPESLIQFKQEYDIMSKLWHPNLARVYDFGQIDKDYYLTMEYIRGCELKSIVKEQEKLDLKEALPIMVSLLRAMEFIHSRNIIYSDIKPQNILITENDQVKLIDFGLSDFEDKVSSASIKGTIIYMSPEVINGTAKDHRADIFSLGVLFYEMITGDILYLERSIKCIFNTLASQGKYNEILEYRLKHINNTKIKTILNKMCAYSAKDRFLSCSEIISHINADLKEKFSIETEETKEAFVVGIPFTGRELELKYLKESALNTENKLVLIMGNQGIGKSELLREFKKWCNINGIFYMIGNSAKGTSYEPFITIVSNILFNFEEHISEQQKINIKKLIPDHPVLSNITIQENEVMDAKTLKDILVETISSIIVNYSVESRKKLVLVFENLINTDEISLEIINEILYKIKLNKIKNLQLFAECRSEEQKKISAFILKLNERDRLKVLKLNEFNEAEVKEYIENSFGKKYIDKTLFEKINDIYKFCGGNPLFLKELIRSMVTDNFIKKYSLYWQFSGSFSNIKLGNNLLDVIVKKINDLKLTDDYYQAMIFMSLSANEKHYIDFYRQYAGKEYNINWQKLFDLLLRKELLQLEKDYYTTPNKLYKEAIQSILSSEDVLSQHKIWVKVLEQQLTPDFKIEELSNNLLFNLSYHYYNCNYSGLEVLLAKTCRFLMESGKREKGRYSNKKAIFYFSRLLKEIKKFDTIQISDRRDIMKYKYQAVRNLAIVYEVIGKWDKANKYFEQCLSIAMELQDEILIGESKCDLGRILLNKGQHEDAMVLLSDSKKIALKKNDKKLYSSAIGKIGLFYYYQGDYSNTMICYEEQKRLYLEMGDKRGYSATIGNMGTMYFDQGDYIKALQCYKEDKQIHLELGDKRGYLIAVGNIGLLHFYQGNYSKAMECFEEIIQICMELGDKLFYSITVGNMGGVYYNQGFYSKALECYEEKKEICLELGDKRGYAKAVGSIGIVYFHQGDYIKAMESYEEQKKICLELKDKRGYSLYVVNMGDLHLTQGNFSKALECFEESRQICLELGIKRGYSIALDNIGLVNFHLGNYIKAMVSYKEAVNIAKELHLNDHLCSCLYNKANLHFILRDYDNAGRINNEALNIANEVQKKDVILACSILCNKLLALDDPEKSIKQMMRMLKFETEKENQALIRYEIYKINESEYQRQKALELYKELNQKICKFEYKKKIDELSISRQEA